MSAIVTLSRQFEQFQQLAFHQQPALAQQLAAVQDWQKNRLVQQHQQLFNQHQRIAHFLTTRLYNLNDLIMLGNQLEKALNEKIKLDRFLPHGVLDAAITAFHLAYLTLKLDEQVAKYILDQGVKTIHDEHIHQAMLALQQSDTRLKQLLLLQQLSQALQHYGRSFLTQSAFRLARRTAYRRQFNFLYDYLTDCFAAIRQTGNSTAFFEAFIAAEKQVLLHLDQGHAAPFGQNCQIAQT
ncbi:MAG: hypothetical protein EOO69_05950 [Moraxellaceae bacterium]|nr:MAG: hypothetical protein EOO69_05950 [Moraxellaceae bacterium]